MDLEEVEAIRNYVKSGGSLYASKYTSLTTKDGKRQKDFLLADVFGCSFVGETEESKTYISPSPGKAADLFGGYTSKYPAMLDDAQLIVKKHRNEPGSRHAGPPLHQSLGYDEIRLDSQQPSWHSDRPPGSHHEPFR